MTAAQIDRTKMFGTPRYVQNSFSVIFPRQLDIRRKINDIESKLSGDYGQPQILNVPDELEAEVPRAIFNSIHSFSQIVINQVSITININYSAEWQINAQLRTEYLINRATMLFDLIGLIKQNRKNVKPFFCGMTTLVHIPSEVIESDTLGFLADLFCVRKPVAKLYDLQRKTTDVVSDKYFNNISIDNYRTWQVDITDLPQVLIKTPRSSIKEHGLQILGDFNDRYAFQHRKTYSTSKSEVFKIIENGITAIAKVVEQLKGEA